ncbi:MAG: nucleotidyl transferase AbiEii/AbiGii toxin family protein [Candidatus Pacebacteria bacterium]|nr:nucleotidyl transferase AbiEii/AbiGii toxin family protein [Candidatus Paceibacterota bacterium]MCF7862888.1 nucleotidyl transferase AbiEii/AbiGii toxin family protein [Candidatus Paceibacterota bacterium]
MYIETLDEKTNKVFHLLKNTVTVFDFCLAGGTGLSLQLGHRISIDLDFFTNKEFETERLIQSLKLLGKLEIEETKEDTFNGSLDGVKISFFKTPVNLLFEKKDFEGLKIADERDISAMKILAISNRGSKKDFVDLYFLLKRYSIQDILNFFKEKYASYGYNLMYILKSLVYFNDAEDDVEPIYIIKTDWKDIKKEIQKITDLYIKDNIN